MIQCLIIDDNPMARLAIRNYVEDVGFFELAGECGDAIQAINLMKKKKVDLFFLDVEMPKMNGLELLEALPEKPLVIVVSSKPDYAVDAFDLEVIDYLVKPVQLPRFFQAANRALEFYTRKNRGKAHFIFIKVENRLTRINLDEILYIKAMGDYVRIITTVENHVTHLSLKGLAEKLPENGFIKTHRSFIVAVDKIDSFADNMLMINQELLPVGETYRANLISKLGCSP